ncbi:adenosylmethionine-8-amino-7-oxononanoate aminotransferase [Desulfosalsimonas propionicica]|uniref:Adenosylmethionine-8-amino-7-oxononanoate aminotransferase n=1 Tax=Desulfosalsimonas propionicica TaxID=332175 RepID=A0A7W0C708_9BACT|nr:adenosylmethionine--8-amino-7-oxononanoate transaminase [Desulfosalsimonas propionicica]MBA2880348.1 adenosylmethionine-8-amino-7-oxononanoate aminotransferase [Desulfosalsimonas propionicica]
MDRRHRLAQQDCDHVWHPYASIVDPPLATTIVSADGVRLYTAEGQALIDGMSSWWAAIHGYNHPVLNNAAHGQIDRMSHVMFGGITHEPAVALASMLVDLTPEPLQKVFFADSGSVSVEVAIKMAVQYWHGMGCPEKNRFLTVRSGYHGDTFGAMALCDPVTGMHEHFTSVLQQHYFAESPGCRFDESWDDAYIQDFRQLMEAHHQQLAAVVLEPIVQGAGGMRFYSPEYLRQVKMLCEAHDVLLVADEIATGFGRTGELFACNYAGISPDIMCLGKALTGGYMTLAATLATDRVSRGISKNGGVLMHGPTFMANPLACAVAEASIRLLLNGPWRESVHRIEQRLLSGLAPCRGFSGVADVRALGAIGVVEMKTPVDLAAVQKQFVNQGVWIRPFGKLIYTMPPYIISDDDLDFLTRAIVRVAGSL